MKIRIDPAETTTQPGGDLVFTAQVTDTPKAPRPHVLVVTWVIRRSDREEDQEKLPQLEPDGPTGPRAIVHVDRDTPPGRYQIVATAADLDDREVVFDTATISVNSLSDVLPPGRRVEGDGAGGGGFNGRPVTVQMKRTAKDLTPDTVFWGLVRKCTNDLNFNRYSDFMDLLINEGTGKGKLVAEALDKAKRSGQDALLRDLLPGTEAYQLLKAATDAYLVVHTGTLPGQQQARFEEIQGDTGVDSERSRFSRRLQTSYPASPLTIFNQYVSNNELERRPMLPYLAIIRRNLNGVRLQDTDDQNGIDDWVSVVYERLSSPCLVELIWSYWHEESTMVQAMAAISQRFQNRRAFDGAGPLSQLEIDPLRPLNRILWGYVDDEKSRLSVLRRAHEYDHHYGLTLQGKAVAQARTVDRRSKFLESFHNLLYRCTQFFAQDDDTTIVADGFPLLNALKETHYLLAQGAHNQFGDLPWQSRREMLIEQWILSRPEMREFVGGRIMVPYPEPWMDRVDAIKALHSWTDVSVVHFHDLAVFGEQILLSVRYGGWSVMNEPDAAANWARYWRAEVQGYIHGYRAVTGVDLSADVTDAQDLTARYVPPSVHLRNRLAMQQRQVQGRR